MAAPTPQLTVRGDAKAALDLRELGVRASAIDRVATAVRRVFLRSEQRIFEMSGPGWQGLADDTKAQKARQGFPDKVMVATGVLRDSLTQITGPQRVYERSPDVLRFGTTVPYAHFHQSGTRFMAQRKLIDLSVKERDEMAGIIMRYITRGQSEGAEL